MNDERAAEGNGTGAPRAQRAQLLRIPVYTEQRGFARFTRSCRRWAVFVHACYWHHHTGCPRATKPKSNRPFRLAKFAAKKLRDMKVAEKLTRDGYLVITLWECERECSTERIAGAVKCHAICNFQMMMRPV
jgi:G:T-mismatch repair DNA endonuclease (very short patch repair protein)